MLSPEEQIELQRLVHEHIPIRAIARRLGRDVKTIRRALGRRAPPPAPPKLAPYHPLIREWCAQDLRSPRILRELRARGYTGGATILKAFLQTLGPRRPPRRAFHRFETGPGVDYGKRRVMLSGKTRCGNAASSSSRIPHNSPTVIPAR